MRRALALRAVVLVAALAASRIATADPGGPTDSVALIPGIWPVPRGGMIAPGGYHTHTSHGGFFVGVDVGAAFLLASDVDRRQIEPTFGAQAGYAFDFGLSLFARYDDLIVEPALASGDHGALQVAAIGARYAVPIVVPLPFVEALVGVGIVPDGATVTAGLGLGLSIPIYGRLFIDLAGRSYLVPLEGALRTVFTADLGVSFRFGR